MATILEALKGISPYPIPLRTLASVSAKRGISLDGEATRQEMRGRAYNLAVADLLLWLSIAPNVTQGGQSYSFTDEQRTQFRNRANALLDEYGDAAENRKPVYGYKGSRL